VAAIDLSVQASGCPRTASVSTCSVTVPWRAVAIPASVRRRVRHRCGAVGRACRFGQARLRMCYYFVFLSASCPHLRAGAKTCRRYAPASGEAKYGAPAGSHVASAKQQMATARGMSAGASSTPTGQRRQRARVIRTCAARPRLSQTCAAASSPALTADRAHLVQTHAHASQSMVKGERPHRRPPRQ
jgi:hypothetical protein